MSLESELQGWYDADWDEWVEILWEGKGMDTRVGEETLEASAVKRPSLTAGGRVLKGCEWGKDWNDEAMGLFSCSAWGVYFKEKISDSV